MYVCIGWCTAQSQTAGLISMICCWVFLYLIFVSVFFILLLLVVVVVVFPFFACRWGGMGWEVDTCRVLHTLQGFQPKVRWAFSRHWAFTRWVCGYDVCTGWIMFTDLLGCHACRPEVWLRQQVEDPHCHYAVGHWLPGEELLPGRNKLPSDRQCWGDWCQDLHTREKSIVR